MSNTSLTGLYQSANSSTSTLRPRTGRLISYIDDEGIESTAISTSTSSTPPLFPSRGVSPNDAAVSRSKSTDRPPRHGRTTKPQAGPSSGISSPTGGNQGLWEPWTSLQGFASTLLGGEVPGPHKDKVGGPLKKPLWMKQDNHYGSKTAVPQWGPSLQHTTTLLQGTTEERQAMVQAKKREALLLASTSENRDRLGKFKRRDSDVDSATAAPADQSEDALVYMHKVEKGDTLAGVIIKYNCQPDLFRKVNRFWPNDNIQTRTHVLVPLEGSTVKGKKVDSPYLSRDLFDPESDRLSAQNASNTIPKVIDALSINGVHDSPRTNPTISSSALTSEPLTLITSLSEGVEFKHDCWVMLPNFKEATEVLRVPRRALGYFPRARRKSNATLTASPPSTPKTSFDTLRHPPTHAAQLSASLNASPVRRPNFPSSRLSSSGRQRSSSATGGNPFAEALRGPGGVGTLRGLRTEASRPGPADDPLNRKFNQYFPDFLPPPGEIPRTGFSTRTHTSRSTPRASSESVRSLRSNSNSSGLTGDVGGAIEGWVRKMAGAAGKRERNAAVDRMGDLIELETNSEIYEDRHMQTEAESDNGGEDITTPTATTTDSATEEALLNERFPVRGRVRTAYVSQTSGKDKDD
ncbi:uncharacterized protein Z520_03309 [Fonsecaea multimorphosa CBS 102226]|uniref:LysM domain-containing protein n=1 Tax=Fonsecaea multimorphosa CBS 102226 TaxID=1442371 RepID=A0A0D2HFD3_9EURO|nr:uncharacterized protein Z520_03309 [Fonsecaea multimorphosa CBS 102226]KIY00646.1 hypothetical protein Z520_03309 [Fonsecaea multimorphosa CBS 102226]OAL19035.1 hypothetical protein AYO22_10364 [Fonsecaea multimorphosa]